MFHHHRGNQASNGLLFLGLGATLGSPLLIAIGFFQIMTAPTAITTAATGGLFLGLTMSTMTFIAIIGVGHAISAALECYKKDQGILDVFKTRLTFNNESTFVRTVYTLDVILYSPFLFIGGLCGMAAKALTNLFSQTNQKKLETKPQDVNPKCGESTNNHPSYSKIIPGLCPGNTSLITHINSTNLTSDSVYPKTPPPSRNTEFAKSEKHPPIQYSKDNLLFMSPMFLGINPGAEETVKDESPRISRR